MIETEELYEKLDAMTEQERVDILDPICEAVSGKASVYGTGGIEVLANRVFALAVLDLYEKWQTEIYEREQMLEGLRDVWGKLTVEEQAELGRELDKMFQEEIDREIISMLREQNKNDLAADFAKLIEQPKDG